MRSTHAIFGPAVSQILSSNTSLIAILFNLLGVGHTVLAKALFSNNSNQNPIFSVWSLEERWCYCRTGEIFQHRENLISFCWNLKPFFHVDSFCRSFRSILLNIHCAFMLLLQVGERRLLILFLQQFFFWNRKIVKIPCKWESETEDWN